MYKAVIFDLDGTLVYTAPECRYLIVGKTLKELGVTASETAIDKFWFRTERDKIISENFGIEPEIFWGLYKKHDTFDLRKKFSKPYDDFSFIQELRQKGYKTGIVTGAPRHILAFELDMLGRENFDAVIRAQLSDGVNPKPHPQGLEMCLKSLGALKENSVYVGNAHEDITAAKNAGVFDIFLDRKEHQFPELIPSLTIFSLYELKGILGF